MQHYLESHLDSLLAIGKIAFTGNFCSYFEQISGSQQNWNRDYDPAIGRYLQSDPIGVTRDYDHNPEFEIAGISSLANITMPSINHAYLYAANNPLRFFDFFGLDVDWVGTPDKCLTEEQCWQKCQDMLSRCQAETSIIKKAKCINKWKTTQASCPGKTPDQSCPKEDGNEGGTSE